MKYPSLCRNKKKKKTENNIFFSFLVTRKNITGTFSQLSPINFLQNVISRIYQTMKTGVTTRKKKVNLTHKSFTPVR